MYIEPNTTIRLVAGCPLEPSYENTLYFADINAQEAYFHAQLYGRLFTKQSYQRKDKNTIRLAANAESLYDYTYMAFRNVNFGNKWFYAFITKIEYVNNVTCEITYSIDVMQTWMFDYVLMPCFVEREHSVTDEIGDNIVEEKLATGDYIADDMQYIEPNFSELQGYQIIFWCTFDRDYQNTSGTQINQGYTSIYSGLNGINFPMTSQGISDAVAWLNDIPDVKISGLVSGNIAPAIAGVGLTREISITKYSALRRVGNELVKNNKCYTYPYNFLYLTNGTGNQAAYRYEFFSGSNCTFSLFADYCTNPTEIIYPTSYKGVTDNLDEKLELTGFPQIAFNVDAFKAWLAQTASQQIVVGSTGALASTGLLPEVANITALLQMINLEVQGVIANFAPPQSKGSFGSNIMLSLNKLKFAYMHKHLTPEYITIIDDYFSMYGYACKKLKRPNISSRPEWNYTKTIGCEIEGQVPTDDAKAIQAIYDKGIRFWKYPEHYLHYEYDNSPVVINP